MFRPFFNFTNGEVTKSGNAKKQLQEESGHHKNWPSENFDGKLTLYLSSGRA
jgi:hypothetical protein